MNILQAIILGLTQGLSEFIPVSSSGHLILLHHLFGVTEKGLSFDVALHVGTLLALIGYFRNDIKNLVISLFRKTAQSRLAWLLALATVPAIVAGLVLESWAESRFRSITLVSVNLIVVAFVMLAAERYSKKQSRCIDIKNIKRSQAVTMGLAQAAAIVPGVSRSGATITAGLFGGLDRISATRFSFLLGIPITAGAAAKVLLGHTARQDIVAHPSLFIVGTLTAALSGLFAIRFMLRYLANHSLNLFAYYRIVLGLSVLILVALL